MIRPSRGFTIVELLIVIVVIGILASIVAVSWSSVVKSSADSARAADVKQWASTFDLYKSRYSTYPAFTAGTYCIGEGFKNNLCGKTVGGLPAVTTATTAIHQEVKKVGDLPKNGGPVAANTFQGPFIIVRKPAPVGSTQAIEIEILNYFERGYNCAANGMVTSTGANSAVFPNTGDTSVVVCYILKATTYSFSP